jgi:hypothetical protein
MDLMFWITEGITGRTSKRFNDGWVCGFGVVRCDPPFASKETKEWSHSQKYWEGREVAMKLPIG